MKLPVFVQVSLGEAAALLRSRYREIVQLNFARLTNRHRMEHAEFPCVTEFLAKILEEITDNGSANYARRPGMGSAAQLLVSLGVPPQEAAAIEVEIFQSVADEITTHLPWVRFGSDQCSYDLMGWHDLNITIHHL